MEKRVHFFFGLSSFYELQVQKGHPGCYTKARLGSWIITPRPN